MKRDLGADMDNEQIDSILGYDIYREIVVWTLSLPTAILSGIVFPELK